MSLSVQYETIDEARMRLEGTVVLYDGKPVYITTLKSAAPGDPKPDIYRVYAAPLPIKRDHLDVDQEEFRKFISSRKFDLSTFPMGFMNIGKTAAYCGRLPKRQYKQGISRQTLQVRAITGNLNHDQTRLDTLVYKQEFVDMIEGKYPAFDEAMRRVVAGEVLACAFNRQYALVGDAELDGLVYLYHKENKVGFVLDGNVKLSKAMKCLKEALNELGLRV